MKKLLILLVMIIAAESFGAGVPWKNSSADILQLGRGNNGDSKSLIFDTGLGAGNPSLGVDTAGLGFFLTKKLNVQGSEFSMLAGVPGDASIVIDEGLGGSNSYIKWDTTANKWKQFDGTTERDIGAGGGGGADAINILSGSNPDAEDGILNWTFAGTGAFTTTDTISEIYGPDGKSFVTDFDAQFETLKSEEKTISQGLYGQSCQYSFQYIGGDSSVNIEASVRNGNDDKVTNEVFLLKAVTRWTPATIYFGCPTESQISGDSELANLYLQFEQIDVGNAAIFRHDKTHLGGFVGLVEMVLPDIVSSVHTGTGVTSLDNNDYINGDCSNDAAGDHTCPFNSGIFTTAPICWAQPIDNAGNQQCTVFATTSSSVDVNCVTSPNTPAPVPYSLSCQKQGVDAQQLIQVVKTLPRISGNVNEFSLNIAATAGTITKENVDWATSAIRSGTNNTQTNITIIAETFTVAPNCQATNTSSSGFTYYNRAGSNATNLRFFTFDSAGASADIAFDVFCQKGADYKPPTVQYTVVGQVLNSYASVSAKNVRVEGCRINNNGTATIDTDSKLCGGWISSVSRTNEGRVTANINTGIFSFTPVCTCVVTATGAAVECFPDGTETTTVLKFRTNVTADDGTIDKDFNIVCIGAR